MGDFNPTDRKLFFTKNDPADPRLGELANGEMDLAEVVVIGYPDDEGIRLNAGREGAALGPDQIRHWLYRTTPHARRTLRAFCDFGNLDLNGSLDSRHARAQTAVRHQLGNKKKVLTLGGGNDYAFPDGMAFLETFAKQKPLIINIDAHLDVRDLSKGPNSGTPFYRLLESAIPFEFVEIGIQGQSNSKHHWDYVQQKGGKIISLDEILDAGHSLVDVVVQAMGESLLRQRPAFLAVDIDAFAWPYAMGSSASWPLGLEPQTFWPLLQFFLKRLDVEVLGIYEVSPPLDVSSGTAKLAAQIAHRFLHHV